VSPLLQCVAPVVVSSSCCLPPPRPAHRSLCMVHWIAARRRTPRSLFLGIVAATCDRLLRRAQRRCDLIRCHPVRRPQPDLLPQLRPGLTLRRAICASVSRSCRLSFTTRTRRPIAPRLARPPKRRPTGQAGSNFQELLIQDALRAGEHADGCGVELTCGRAVCGVGLQEPCRESLAHVVIVMSNRLLQA